MRLDRSKPCLFKTEKDVDIVSDSLFVIEVWCDCFRDFCMAINVVVFILDSFYQSNKVCTNLNTVTWIKIFVMLVILWGLFVSLVVALSNDFLIKTNHCNSKVLRIYDCFDVKPLTVG